MKGRCIHFHQATPRRCCRRRCSAARVGQHNYYHGQNIHTHRHRHCLLTDCKYEKRSSWNVNTETGTWLKDVANKNQNEHEKSHETLLGRFVHSSTVWWAAAASFCQFASYLLARWLSKLIWWHGGCDKKTVKLYASSVSGTCGAPPIVGAYRCWW